METFNELKSFISSMEDDVAKFNEKGNKAAGLRIRKSLNEIKIILQKIRLETLKDVKGK